MWASGWGKHLSPISALGGILYFNHRGSSYLLLIFGRTKKEKKEEKKKHPELHDVQALASSVRKQFRTEALENQ